MEINPDATVYSFNKYECYHNLQQLHPENELLQYSVYTAISNKSTEDSSGSIQQSQMITFLLWLMKDVEMMQV